MFTIRHQKNFKGISINVLQINRPRSLFLFVVFPILKICYYHLDLPINNKRKKTYQQDTIFINALRIACIPVYVYLLTYLPIQYHAIYRSVNIGCSSISAILVIYAAEKMRHQYIDIDKDILLRSRHAKND